MKNSILYILIFIVTFILTTAGIVYFNEKYENIFAFNFKPVVDSVKLREELLLQEKKLAEKKKQDSLAQIRKNDSILAEIQKQEELLKLAKLEKKKQDSLKIVEKKLKEQEAYKEWIKSTLKIFAKMDAKNVVKILENYSDNVVRDLIYEMKDAQAAEVLSVLAKTNPERAAKITGAKYANQSTNSGTK
ncbi:MAG TPA: hypothetical protein PLI27_03735 [Ignavibacteriales bacterium]|nr:hypothetical protein [Ignavibacteriales bacterium]HOL80699.1 hypothetical protein [Ignavibacteriales bacterium]HOM64386.1 hypothetical protein [Ignavibacteriales bacterium]HPD67174.1 hypothetical protein [Ignavibacteriales bacterium]HPP32968.1 hypothetical protein [Ignavibacteriales bacterium]